MQQARKCAGRRAVSPNGDTLKACRQMRSTQTLGQAKHRAVSTKESTATSTRSL